MPVKLDTFPALPSQSRYDWETLLNGDIWKLSPGADFGGKTRTFVAAARAQAKRRGGRVRTRLLEDAVVIQFRRES
jgi:hypothetical protein